MTKLSEMSKTELIELAAEFAVDADESLNEKQIIARFVEDGVTQDMVNTFLEGKAAREAEREAALEAEEQEEKPAKKARAKKEKPLEVPEQVLLYMDRENGSYRIRGYTFTREHPFALVKSDDADFIVEHEEGFSYATPRQAAEFYGG